MLSLNTIERYYPEKVRLFKKNILREYLQYKILQIVFESEYAAKLSFMGGTCLRIIFGTNRFSEDLDFDNFGLTIKEFDELSGIVAKRLEDEGYIIEIKTVHKAAFRCYIRIPRLLFDNKLSGYEEEKILIQLDTEAQNYDYTPESHLMTKFGILTKIQYTPQNVLLSQKLWAILNRRTAKGRDFYDASFLFSLTKPDYDYLQLKAGIKNGKQLKEKLNIKLKSINVNQLLKDVKPFLIEPNDFQRIEYFSDYINEMK